MTSDEKRELMIYSEAFRDGHNEGFSNGFEDGLGAGKAVMKQRILATYGDEDEIPESILLLLRND